MAVWLVRAGRGGEWESFALDNGLAVIGWSELPNLMDVQSRDQLYTLLEQTYPGEKRNTLVNWAGQIWPFISVIQPGDVVVLPLKTRSAIAMGEVIGPYQYRTDLPLEARHVRPVRWMKELPRTAFDQDLLYSLGAFMTVCRIQRNNAEERIRALLHGNVVSTQTVQRGEDTDSGEWMAPPDLEQYALDQIRDYITRRFKGHGLARLVGAVLEAQGYRVMISPEGPDGGVDIIAGQGPMGFDHPRIVVQVKSGDSPVDVKVVRELQGVIRNFGADHGLIVAWGGYKSTVTREASRQFFELRLWDADDLVKAVLSTYEKLPEALQAELPLKRIWVLVGEEGE
ncbi:restriction endonuclease [Alicyclobacillus macrosporangiidus]|uniref:restriction endonuclease n=1 Tax=Alicyclobacillus macrosporangiidus TaxID=392015 RepID=UPI0004960BF7|nr:restriction endonuclease [Alicyclobacillus macrosporangiidus]